MYQIYSNTLHPCILCKWEESPHWPPPLRFSLLPCPLKQRRGQVGLARDRTGCQLLSVCFPTCTRPPTSSPCFCPWSKDSCGTRTPRMTVSPGRTAPQRCHSRPTQRQRSTERARTDSRPLCSDSETDKEANPGPSGLPSPSNSRDVQGEHREAGVCPTVSPPAVCAPQHSLG